MTTLTDAEKTEVRRFCGYPVYGGPAANLQSWRFYQTFGLMEFRMNNLSGAELSVVRRYIATLSGLEMAVPRSGDNLDTDQADVWTRNRQEPRDREQLFDGWRRRLCGFLGIPPGPSLTSGSPSLVV